MKRTPIPAILAPLIVLALPGCGLVEAEVRHFDEERTYEHALFESPEACEAAQPPDFFINCSQWMDFHPDGRVTVVLSDIINPGTYRIRDVRVTLTMEGSPELPNRIELLLSADESTLVEEATGRVWTRASDGG
jgi:hypothetical protein